MQPVISLESIWKIYQTGDVEVTAVRDVSLTVLPGEFIAIMGASGSGKSTLMNTLGCLDRPTRGRFLLDGVDVAQLDRNELADLRNEKLGFVFQGFNLLARTTALENVELPMLYGPRRTGSREMRERTLHCLDIVGLSDRADHFPSQLSGGQQQRVAIARALVNEPQILLADEPTGNLDSKSEKEVMEIFHGLHAAGLTVILVTHNPEIAEHAQRTIFMRDGIIQEGPK